MYYCWRKDKSIRPSVFWNMKESELKVIRAFVEQEIEEERKFPQQCPFLTGR
ncbi:MAG TPA: hypothetical protein VHP38_15095 [Ruminiclostridium sp.]|nr:hypothetical protein [Ruminiclostridium sp.]